MVTASHNPKADNGYKVYWNTGSQIVPPHDSGIAAAIQDNLEPWKHYNTTDSVIFNNPLAENVTAQVASAYYAAIVALSAEGTRNSENPVKAVYTGKTTISFFQYDMLGSSGVCLFWPLLLS